MTQHKITIEKLKEGNTYGTEIYQQIVGEIDLTAIIFAVNGIKAQALTIEEAPKAGGYSLQNLLSHLADRPSDVKDGVASIAEERARQIKEKDFNDSHDDCATNGQLAKAAACYAMHSARLSDYRAGMEQATPEERGKAMPQWPWDIEWWKPTTRRRDLVKAGALIAAEIDRLDRMEGGDA